jgi:hypothetical protein
MIEVQLHNTSEVPDGPQCYDFVVIRDGVRDIGAFRVEPDDLSLR